MTTLLSAGAWLLTHPTVHTVLAAASGAASPAPTPTDTDGSGEDHKAGPWGLGIVLLLCIGCFFLFRSMSGQLRKVRETFPEEGYRIDRHGHPVDEINADISATTAGSATSDLDVKTATSDEDIE